MPTIQELREARGWSQYELAQRVGCTQTALSYWETGKREPKASQYRRLGEAFGVLMEDINLVTPDTAGQPRRGRPPKQPAT